MNCPICKTPLSVVGQKRLETLSEHVCDPNGTPSLKDVYSCNNPSCSVSSKKPMWSEEGEYFGFEYSDDMNSSIALECRKGPLGSWERKAYMEIYDHTGDRTILNVFFITVNLEWAKIADRDGNILKRRPYIRILKRDMRRPYYTWWKSIGNSWAHKVRTELSHMKEIENGSSDR